MINVPGQHWYIDVWGPDETPSLLHMTVYTIGFCDAMSDAIWLYHSRTKDAVLDCVRDLYERVIKPRRIAHNLKTLIVQLDNGEFKSNAVLEFLQSVGGERLTFRAYSPESKSKIERVWGVLHNTSSAMLIEKKLPKCYCEWAQDYTALIYNSIPPIRTRPPVRSLALLWRSSLVYNVTNLCSKCLDVERLHTLISLYVERTMTLKLSNAFLLE